ncbi:hypothetical protein B0H14DRAFT_2561895 [Mycena olivaceomarginata]|nr:hypothetical protein B0H14DRAFT_2561895 [Mycena olivaceomarginata]
MPFFPSWSLLVTGCGCRCRDNSPGQHMYRFEHSLVNDDEHLYHYLDIHGLVHHHLDVHSLVHHYLDVYRDRYGHRYPDVHRDRFGHHYLNDDHYYHYNANHDLIDLDQYEYFNEHLRPCLCADHNLMDVPRMLSRQRLLPDPQRLRGDHQRRHCGELPDYLFKSRICLRRRRRRGSVLLRLVHQIWLSTRRHLQHGLGPAEVVNAIDIYEAVVAPCVTPWTYRGCYSDNVSARILNGYGGTFSTNSVASCQTTCLNRGYAYAGVEDGSQCFCASSIGSSGTLQGETHCQTPCSGGGGTCGGVDYIAIYETATTT